MTMRIPLAVALGLVTLGIVSTSGGQELAIGAARVDITPDGPIRLGGYLARDAESRGVGQRIWAKAVALGGDHPGAALIVAVDNVGVPAAITEELAARLARRAGIRRERLALGSSHTH